MLSFAAAPTESELRHALVSCGQICYERGLLTSNDGNLSVRLDAERILITASGMSKGRMDESDLLTLDLDGKILAAKPGCRPSSETPMHLEVYKQRADVRAVIHAHPIFATTLTVSGIAFPADLLPEVLLTLGDVPTTAYATSASEEDAVAIRPFIKNYDALLLRQHGSLTVGKDLEQALINLERVEHVAEVFWRAQMLGKVERLPAEAQEKLKGMKTGGGK